MPKTSSKNKKPRAKHYLYKSAELMEFSSGWQIRYKCLDIETGNLELQKERFQRQRRAIGDDKMARIAGKRRCEEINELLKKGWTPDGYLVDINEEIEESKEIEGHKLFDLMDIYYKLKSRELREDSMRSINSYNNLFKEWLTKIGKPNTTIEEFNKDLAMKYLDHVLIDKGVSNCTYNNYVANMRAMFNFFINERKFDVKNYFEKLKKKPRGPKFRKIIPKNFDEEIVKYCQTKDPVLELVCELVYHSYMRPKEICRCRVRNVSLKNKAIYLPRESAKKDKSRVCYLSDRAIEIMIEQGINDIIDIDNVLISKEAGNAGRLIFGKGPQITTPQLDRNWYILREALNLPKQYQLYSWRDSGVTDLSQLGLSDDDIIKITGHLDKEMVDIYREPGVDLQVTRILAQVGQSIGHRKNPINERERLLKILTNE